METESTIISRIHNKLVDYYQHHGIEHEVDECDLWQGSACDAFAEDVIKDVCAILIRKTKPFSIQYYNNLLSSAVRDWLVLSECQSLPDIYDDCLAFVKKNRESEQEDKRYHTTNYKDLLIRYAKHVGQEEGVLFVERSYQGNTQYLSPVECRHILSLVKSPPSIVSVWNNNL